MTLSTHRKTMDNEQNIQPVPTTFVKRGNSLYLKIPPMLHKHLGIQDMKQPDTPDKKEAECYGQKSSKGEHYISGWDPKHPSQRNEDDNQ